ncbi:MAG: hypothetical protein DMG31_10050 [Acidobacteria bacterium]|nr:MAG: hypothetical protein DMG31_10050 [Acidobacteriota bacterium]
MRREPVRGLQQRLASVARQSPNGCSGHSEVGRWCGPILEEFRRASDSLAEKWVQRDTQFGIRAFALVNRSSLPVFLEKIASVLTPAGISARVTGPWPPSEFVEVSP